MKTIILACVLCLVLPSVALPELAGDVAPREEIVRLNAEDAPVYEVGLEDCVRHAVLNSFEAKLAKLDLLVAETRKTYAEAVFDTILFGSAGYIEDKRKTASFFGGEDIQTNIYMGGVRKRVPSGTELTVSWRDQRDRTDSPLVSPNPSHTAQLTFEAVQPVLRNTFGFIDRSTITLASLAVMNADLETRERIEQLIADVEKAYWAVVYRKKALDINADMLNRAEELYGAVKRNFDLGLAERPDVLATQANVLIRKKDVILAKDKYRRSREDLKFLMNVPADAKLSPRETFSREVEEPSLEKSIRTAFRNSRVYRKLKGEVEIRDVTLKMESNRLWPELDLEGTFAMNGLDSDFAKAAGSTVVMDNTYCYAGVRFSFPLENSMARAERDRALHEKEKALLALKREERSIITRTGNALGSLVSFNRAVSKVGKAVGLQEEKLREEEKRFASGRSSTKNLIDYQEDLLRAEMQEAAEFFARETARVDLEKEMNVLLEKYERLL